MSFSERMGLEQGRQVFQLDSMDRDLRIALYNYLLDQFLNAWTTGTGLNIRAGYGHLAARHVWTDFLRYPADEFSSDSKFFRGVLKEFVLEGPWNKVYDLIEFAESETSLRIDEKSMNRILERDMSGYRWREGRFVAITDATELAAVDGALRVSEPFAGARTHIIDALDKLSQKPEPDFRNAITEAVSAVESAARVVTGKPKAMLTDALNVLDAEHKVHPALKAAWGKLYGYTSDEQGLRHAMTNDPNVDFATAKYMVVSCAAFVNVLSALPPQV